MVKIKLFIIYFSQHFITKFLNAANLYKELMKILKKVSYFYCYESKKYKNKKLKKLG